MADMMNRILLDHPIWNEIIAPNISELKRGEIPPLKTNRPALAMFALGAATFLNIETATRVRLFNFIRKAVVATDAFNLARTHYDRLFSSTAVFDEYFLALTHFENCLAAAHQGHEVLFGIRDAPFFNNNTRRGELNSRMGRMYNSAKHVESFVGRSGFTGDVIPVWIIDDGLATSKDKLLFKEIGEMLDDMCGAANLIIVSTCPGT